MKKTKQTNITKFKHDKMEILEYIFMYVGFLAIVGIIVLNCLTNVRLVLGDNGGLVFTSRNR